MTEYGLIQASNSDEFLEQQRQEEAEEEGGPISFILDDDDEVSEDNDVDDLTNGEIHYSGRITVDEAIERLGMGRFQLYILIAAGLSFASDAMQVMVLSFLGEVLKVEWNLTEEETAMISSILFVGAIFGTLMLGPLADKKGRKPIFLISASIISIFSLAVSFATSYRSVLALLFFVGFGVGGLTVPFDILSEVLPAASRGKNLLVIEYFWSTGVLLVVVFARSTLGTNGESGNWRLFVVLSAIPCWISVIVGYFFVPESPRWLCTQPGRAQEALDIIRKAAERNRIDVDFNFPATLQIAQETEEEESDFCELFSEKWRWTTIKLWGAWAAFAFAYFGTIMTITEIFDDSDPDGSNDFDYGAIFVSSSAELIGTTIAIILVDVVGRIPLQVMSYSLGGVSVYALCRFAEKGMPRNTLLAFSFAARIFEMSGTCVTWISTAEILTTEVRTTGHSAANAVARIGSIIAPFLVQGDSSLATKGLVMLGVHSLAVLCVSQLPETKGSHMGHTQVPDSSEHLDDDNDDYLDHESNATSSGSIDMVPS
ncbi:unnamed protein product [Cylindrotheca closterium]|uniref:Major facilitator superfamily (MFS) profile domain-containing protein n=1 Tax=Cylindrotheca closterium TaxID=2856 RepID=A0AAD2GD24_9STRA|nr:unnamed protein product [Cylindrotheca closterium]